MTQMHGAGAPTLDIGTEFDAWYRDAGGDPSSVPLCDTNACPCLVAWLNAEASEMVRPGGRAVVAGCGLGENVRELIGRGYDACGFDISPACIEWAGERRPDLGESLRVADLLDTPGPMHHRFDLVIDIDTLALMPEERCGDGVRAITELAHPHGVIVVIGDGEPARPPMSGLDPDRLVSEFGAAGFSPHRIDDYSTESGQRRVRGVFRRV